MIRIDEATDLDRIDASNLPKFTNEGRCGEGQAWGSVARTTSDRQRESAPYLVALAAAIVTALSAHPDSLDRCSFDPIREPSR